MITGCPETYQTFQESHQGQQGREQEGQHGQQGREQEGQHGQQGREQEGQQGQQGQQFRRDEHQKIREIQEGEVAAVPTGVGHYIYNDGNRRLVIVSVIDISNENNQLDFNPRRTYLFGNPQNEFPQGQEQQQQEEQGSQGQQEQEQGSQGQKKQGQGSQGQQQQEQGSQGQKEQGQGSQGQQQQQESSNGNIFRGFDTELLAEAFQVDAQIIRKLQGQNDRRGNIVRLDQGMEGLVPPRGQQQQEEQQQGNGYEETLCSLRLKQDIGDPRRADVYTPRGGHRTSVTAADLPVLRVHVKLSAHYGKLNQNAMMLPYFNVNANSILYVIRGSARIQVVNHQGRKVFNEEVQQGQVLVIPQNFAAMIKARDSGFQYVAVKTNEEATINTLAGNLSLLRAVPAELVANAIQGSNEQAKQLKFNRQEMVIAAPGSSRFEY